MTLDQLPPRYREQAMRKLGLVPDPPKTPEGVSPKDGIPMHGPRQMDGSAFSLEDDASARANARHAKRTATKTLDSHHGTTIRPRAFFDGKITRIESDTAKNDDNGKPKGKDQSPKLPPGTRFGKLVVIEAARTVNKRKCSICRCDCGELTIVQNARLVSGEATSCGSLAHDARKAKTPPSRDPLHRVWEGIRYRCLNPNAPQYHNYGARGISVCEEWLKSFGAFRAWATANGYHRGLSIDRIDNDGNYEPSNCRWTDTVGQGRNRRTNIALTYNGDSATMMDWSERTGLGYTTILERHRAGWTPEEIITTPKRAYNRGGARGRRKYARFCLNVNPLILSTGQQKKMNFATKMIFTDSRVANGMRLIELAAKPHTEEIHGVCPPGTRVALTVVFLCPYPEGVRDSERVERAPMGEQFDCDNKYKAVGDAFVTAGWWPDDRYVTSLHIEKRRTVAMPRIEILVEPDTKRPLSTINDEEDLEDSTIAVEDNAEEANTLPTQDELGLFSNATTASHATTHTTTPNTSHATTGDYPSPPSTQPLLSTHNFTNPPPEPPKTTSYPETEGNP